MVDKPRRQSRAQIENGMRELAKNLMTAREPSNPLTLGELAQKLALVALAVSDLSGDSRI